MSAPEFARPERLDTIGSAARTVTVVADAEECRRLAGRFRLLGVERLAGDFTVLREAAGVRVRGRVTAAVSQACSVTGRPVAATVDEPVDLLFAPAPAAAAAGEEVELGDDSIDVVFLDGGAIDLGETAAETMALALDPYPRSDDADSALRAAGVRAEGEAGAPGGLGDLLKRAGTAPR